MKKNNNLASKIYSKNTIKMVNDKINLLGEENVYSAEKLLNMRLLICIFVFVITILFFDYGYFIAKVLTVLVYLS